VTTSRRAHTVRFRQQLIERRPALGVFCKSRDPAVIEALAYAGYEFAVADLDHSALGLSDVEQLVRAADAAELPVLVRLTAGGLHDVGRVLDAGAAGVQVVDVTSVEDARRWRSAARYPPDGTRGLAFSQRAASFGAVSPREYLEQARRGTTVVAQIESLRGISALPEILQAGDLVDALFLGPVDLSASMGHPADVDHPSVVAALDAAATQIVDAGAPLGIFAADLQQAARWAARGATMIVVGSDMTLVASAARHVTSGWRSLQAG
jgi:2-keto-3-deoxy-L-rhamnonate aldolase RhmA